MSNVIKKDPVELAAMQQFFDQDVGIVSVTSRAKKERMQLPETPHFSVSSEATTASLLPRLVDVPSVDGDLLHALKPDDQVPSWDQGTFYHYLQLTQFAIQQAATDVDPSSAYGQTLKTTGELLAQEAENQDILRSMRMVLIQEK